MDHHRQFLAFLQTCYDAFRTQLAALEQALTCTCEACSRGAKLDLKPLPQKTALLHGHCHQKAFGAMSAVQEALALVPGLRSFGRMQPVGDGVKIGFVERPIEGGSLGRIDRNLAGGAHGASGDQPES